MIGSEEIQAAVVQIAEELQLCDNDLDRHIEEWQGINRDEAAKTMYQMVRMTPAFKAGEPGIVTAMMMGLQIGHRLARNELMDNS